MTRLKAGRAPAGDEPAWSVNQPAARPRPSACGGVRTDVETLARWSAASATSASSPVAIASSSRVSARSTSSAAHSHTVFPGRFVRSNSLLRGAGACRRESPKPGRIRRNPRHQLPTAPERSAPRSSAVLVEPPWQTPPSRHPSNRRAPTTIPAMLTRAPTMAAA